MKKKCRFKANQRWFSAAAAAAAASASASASIVCGRRVGFMAPAAASAASASVNGTGGVRSVAGPAGPHPPTPRSHPSAPYWLRQAAKLIPKKKYINTKKKKENKIKTKHQTVSPPTATRPPDRFFLTFNSFRLRFHLFVFFDFVGFFSVGTAWKRVFFRLFFLKKDLTDF